MFHRTERLLLRPGWAEDAAAVHRLIADEAVVRNLATAPWPYRLDHAEAFLGTERMPHESNFLVFRRTDGAPELVGSVGLGRRPTGELELGYWIGRRHWGNGYATEAGRAVLEIACQSLRLRKLSSGHFLDNPASGRVLEKLGFRPTGIIAPRYSAGRGEMAPCRLFELELSCAGCGAEETAETVPAMMAA
ncbi:MAG: GNAT family N-acetyltransferase [Alphaproteobacteria bacterium]|nr:MAG: GNAT family N-acetyltransferase [Alphaproteobacteria bacterium]